MEEDFYIDGDDIQDFLFVNVCSYNEGVSCVKKDRTPYQCEKCGWNPKVANRRKRKTRKEFSAKA